MAASADRARRIGPRRASGIDFLTSRLGSLCREGVQCFNDGQARRPGPLLMGLKNDSPVGSGCWWTVDSPTVEDTMLIRTRGQNRPFEI